MEKGIEKGKDDSRKTYVDQNIYRSTSVSLFHKQKPGYLLLFSVLQRRSLN